MKNKKIVAQIIKEGAPDYIAQSYGSNVIVIQAKLFYISVVEKYQ